jgi:hypothetical protein
MLKFISSAMICCGFKPSSVANCLTMIGGLIRMMVCGADGAAAAREGNPFLD